MEASSTGQVVAFLDSNVIGRTVASRPLTTKSGDGGVETTYVDQNFYSNLMVGTGRFSFDLTLITLGRRFSLDGGERAELAGSLDAVRVLRYEMTERVSTGELLGFARFISSSNDQFDPMAGTVFMVQMRMDGDDLVVTDTQMGYGDFPAADGSRRPAAVEGRSRFAVRDGRLFVSYDQALFDVDPATMERKRSADRFPTQESVELADREGELTKV